MTRTACRPDGRRQFGADRHPPREPEERAFRNAIKLASSRLLGAPTPVEASIVALGQRGEAGLEQMQALLDSLKLETVLLTPGHARLAIDAFRRFGKGRHPAGLNFGECLPRACQGNR